MIGFEKNISATAPVSRSSLVWLFVVQVFILAPHFLAVPVWIVAVWLVVVFWRWKIFQGAWNYPKKLHKTLLVLLCTAGLILSLGLNFSLMAMVSLLLVGFSLKLLEMKNQKDFVLLIYIALFILATQFIFFNHVLAALYGFVCLLLLCASLMQLYQGNTEQQGSVVKKIKQALRSSGFILLQAIPLMVVLFVAMPRLGSFWAVPAPQHAKTGMSDSMSPGEMSELIKSDELAFRVTFTDDIPANEKLYWRSLVFSYFDGRRWSQARNKRNEQTFSAQDFQTSSQPALGWRKNIHYIGDKTTYEIIAEPSGQSWLYALAAPEVWSNDVVMASDLHLQARSPVDKRLSYRVTSALNYRIEVGAQEAAIREQNLQLPEGVNPETRRLAHEWLIETGDAEKLIEKLFDYYHRSFFYTLRPPSLGKDTVDEFLWQSRQGFCEHFASSFVFFMRAAGIPARVVVGYQGGELNPVEHYLVVRQRDAHAWAEVWVENRGWVLFDPTSAVAPERIRHGIEESLSATDQQLLHQPFGDSFKLLMALRNQWDAFNYQWTRWIMNYDSSLQATLLSKLLSNVNPMRIAVLILVVSVAVIALIFTVLFFRSYRRKLSPKERAAEWVYKQLCKKIQRSGVEPALGESPRQIVMRAVELHPHLASALYEIIDLYEQFIYAENAAVLPELKARLTGFSPKNTPKV